ncbi:MAG: hypothetical protein MZV65_04235 [Chromatiales bacterium]|nr:hypothetical protein [Chromatiales bacterium]
MLQPDRRPWSLSMMIHATVSSTVRAMDEDRYDARIIGLDVQDGRTRDDPQALECGGSQ